MSEALSGELNGPVVQSITIGFRVLFVTIAVLAVGWVASSWRQVPADSQAVVFRFGRIVAVQQAGLVVSWPPPVGRVDLLPGAERLLTLTTLSPAGNGLARYLTGDGGVVLLAATVSYGVTDAAAYDLAQAHVASALQRVLEASAVTVAAAHGLDDFLVTGSETDPASAAVVENRRQVMRADLLQKLNRRLGDMGRRAVPLGVVVRRVDLHSALPSSAKDAYDEMLESAQLAEQRIASARTDITRMGQSADRERDRLLTAARASAAERVGDAQAKTAAIVATHAAITDRGMRTAVLTQLWQDQLSALMPKAGRVTAVDAEGGARVILPANPGQN